MMNDNLTPICTSVYKILAVFVFLFGVHQIFGQDSEFCWEELPESYTYQGLVAIDGQTYYAKYPQNKLFYQNMAHDVPFFQDIYRMLSGALIGATYDVLLRSEDNGISWDTLRPGVDMRDGLKMGYLNTLYLFRDQGIWRSEDEGDTWSHTCPDEYFPEFSIRMRTAAVARPDVYYGSTSNGNVLKFDEGRNATTYAYQLRQDGNRALVDFGVTYSDVYALEKSIPGQVLSFSGNGQKYTLPLGTKHEIDIWQSGPLIHTSNQIFHSFNDGAEWFDYTANLPDTVDIISVSVARDNTVYITNRKGFNYRSKVKSLSTNGHLLKSLQAYPNPAWDRIKIDTPNPNNIPTSIYDISGQCLSQQSLGPDGIVQLENLPSGIYILQVGNLGSVKFLKQ